MVDRVFLEANDKEIIYSFMENLSRLSLHFAIFGGVAISIYTNGLRKMSPDDIDIIIDEDEFEIRPLLEDMLSRLNINILRKNSFEGSRWWFY